MNNNEKRTKYAQHATPQLYSHKAPVDQMPPELTDTPLKVKIIAKYYQPTHRRRQLLP